MTTGDMMKRLITIPALYIICCSQLFATPVWAASIVGSAHDLSAQSPSRIKADNEKRICIFCHTPHHATNSTNPESYGPLWSRKENIAVDYTPYRSNTIAANPGQPQGSSRVCLSCHDGTIALGSPTALGISSSETFGGKKLSDYSPPVGKKTAVLGKNLSDDHPVSMEYGMKQGEFVDPGPVLGRLLSWRNTSYYVECTSCHSPHDNEYGNFLVADTSAKKDAICTMCHNKSGWSGSDHKAADGCVSCHTPHGAQQGVDLLVFSSDAPLAGISPVDSNCATSACHSAVATQFTPTGRYVHPLTYDNPTNQHLDTEPLPLTLVGDGNPSLSGSKHVHCIDCHNPHKANNQNSPLVTSNAPAVNGVLQGVRGVTENVVAIDDNQGAIYEYQICFKCHAGSIAAGGNFNGSVSSGGPYVERFYASLDESERFKNSARSSHPVVVTSAGDRSNLVSGYGSGQYVYCSSCHNSHGSSQPHLLKSVNWEVFDTTSYSSTSYALCFGCHDEAYLMTSAPSANLHTAHVKGPHKAGSNVYNPTYYNYLAACSVCHDPHGVPAGTGSTSDNAAHLINFQQRYVPLLTTVYYNNNSNPPYPAKSCFIPGAGAGGTTCHAGAASLYQTNYNTSYP